MKYVALLRGINVGGNNKVGMKKLKEVFEHLGYANVSTYINSGNVLFESDKKDFSRIEPALKKSFGFAITVVIRDAKNIEKLCKAIPKDWENNTEQKTDILFLWDEFDNKKSIGFIKTNKDVDVLKYISGSIIWHIKRKDYSKSGMSKFIGGIIYKNMTARNINTVRKLLDRMK